MLRRELGVMAFGDLRRAFQALAKNRDVARLTGVRFPREGSLGGHSLGNLLYAAAEMSRRDRRAALAEIRCLFDPVGDVWPASFEDAQLVARYRDGAEVAGEGAIDLRGFGAIESLRLDRPAAVAPEVAEAARAADLIALAPGDFMTSVMACCLPGGLAEEIARARGRLALFFPAQAKPGETDGLTASEILKFAERTLGRRPDVVLAVEPGDWPRPLPPPGGSVLFSGLDYDDSADRIISAPGALSAALARA